jgi:hypothetical protein
MEAAFREAMELWAYRQFWRLWEVSTSEGRFAVTQSDFAALMERGGARPAAGRQVEDLKISPTSPQTALVVARIGLEDRPSHPTLSVVRSFLLYFQDGRWRPQLSDFLGLASYSVPWQPLNGPVTLIVPGCPVPVLPQRSPKATRTAPSAPFMPCRQGHRK